MQGISAEQLKQMQSRDEDFLLVNTLDEEHFLKTRIPGAVNIPQSSDDFAAEVEQKAGGKSKPVVVYCANQQCDSSSKAAQKLEAAGFAVVLDFESGAEGWQQAGETLESGSTV